MYRFAPFLLLGAMALAQTQRVPQTEKPPAYLDAELRQRVTDIYTMWKNGDYRNAEALVAKDTKEYYYAGNKPEIHSFEVLDIQYFDDFTKARAITKVTEPVTIAGFPPGEMTVKMPTEWKIEDGKWMLYQDMTKLSSPGGIQQKIQAAVEAANTAGATGGGVPAEMPKEMPKTADFALGKLSVDKTEILISAGETATVTFSNSSAGLATLEPGYPLKGIEAKLDMTEVPAGKKAVLTFHAGKDGAGGVYYVRVLPTGEAFGIRVTMKQ